MGLNAESHLPRIPGKKKWKPPVSKYPELELFLSNIKKEIINPHIRLTRPNLSKGERAALRELKKSDKVIRIQDKGSRFVVLNPEDYENKMLGQLNNELHYKPVQSDPTSKHISLVEK